MYELRCVWGANKPTLYSFRTSEGDKKKRPAPTDWCGFPSEPFRAMILEKYGNIQNFSEIVNRAESTVRRWISTERFPVWARPYIFSEYCRVFDNHNKLWSSEDQFNVLVIANNRGYLNNKLAAHGYVFLNDVYNTFGFNGSIKGQIYGWTHAVSGEIKMSVVFYKDVAIIDFNPEGIILDWLDTSSSLYSPSPDGTWSTRIIAE